MDLKSDSLKVAITYQLLTTKFHCGNVVNSSGITQIKLISITANKNQTGSTKHRLTL